MEEVNAPSLSLGIRPRPLPILWHRLGAPKRQSLDLLLQGQGSGSRSRQVVGNQAGMGVIREEALVEDGDKVCIGSGWRSEVKLGSGVGSLLGSLNGVTVG